MNITRNSSRFALPLALAVATWTDLQAQHTHVIPNGFATAEGSTTNLFPWGRGNNLIHIQFLYDSSHFTNASISGPIVISRLRWRADRAPSAWTGGTYATVQVDMSTAAVDYATPSTTFAANHGPDRMQVLNGPVRVAPGQTNGIDLGPWFVDFALTTPFPYDPGSGNDLCIDVQFDATQWGGGTTSYLDIHGSGALATRIFNSTSLTSATGTIGQNHGAVIEVSYAPATGLTAGFMADVTRGTSPLQVQFRDLSYSSAPGGILAHAWDLDGDGIVDSNLPNPTFLYSACGSYNVSLTVFDALHGPSTMTRTAYITTDEITPGFTWAPIGPNTIQFTDTSTPPASSWAWDLDGDGITDSTAQNPTWIYPRGCTVVPGVRLAVTRQCQGPVSTTRDVYVGDSLATTFAGGSASIGSWGSLFDLQVLDPEGISICAVSAIANAALNLPFQLDCYVTPDTYVGKEANPAAWRLVGSGNGTVAGFTVPTVVGFANSIYLAPGNYGIALYPSTTGFSHTTGTQTFANADLALTAGAIRTDLFGSLGQFGSTTANRIWNGAIHYTTQSSSGESGYGFFAPGCAGASGVPGNVATAQPRIGLAMSVAYSNLPQNAVFALMGFSRTMSNLGPLPLDLVSLGAPGCFARVSPDSVLLLLGGGGTAGFNLALPNDPIFLGSRFYTQGLALDAAANTLGVVTSDAAAAIVGQ